MGCGDFVYARRFASVNSYGERGGGRLSDDSYVVGRYWTCATLKIHSASDNQWNVYYSST